MVGGADKVNNDILRPVILLVVTWDTRAAAECARSLSAGHISSSCLILSLISLIIFSIAGREGPSPDVRQYQS